jgi:phosphoribosylanthranilate isomerase
MLAASGVDAVGLNLVSSSPRCVTVEEGCQLAAFARELGLATVAVTMNESHRRLNTIIEQVRADFIQLHGAELPESVSHLKNSRIIKSVSWSGRTEEWTLAERWLNSDHLCAFLVDAYAPEVGGGSGRVARWDLLSPRPGCFNDYPLILAGGLTEHNLASAISQTQCEAVDSASGVENRPGEKDSNLVAAFVRSARTAFHQ